MTILQQLFEKPGDTYKDYTCLRIQPIDELRLTFIEVKHQTGAIIQHIECDDEENVFCLSFKTPPDSSSGVAHILEHSVLCGSRKYPVRDPFFAMIRRSLNTFMNAFTGPDYTCYPAASQNEKDFYNLLDVYIDATFFPILRELSFQQEGHHLEFAKIDDPTSELRFGGIVYNEMKGDMASIDSRLYHKVIENLLPDTPYGFNSGGDPKEIPNLTFEKFTQFHTDHYAPSRCHFYFYGNISLKHHLDYLQKRLFDSAAKLPYLPISELQKPFLNPKLVEGFFPVESGEDISEKTAICFAWSTCFVKDQQELLALTLLVRILMETDASPLKFALLHSKKCKSASLFLESELSQVPLLLVLKGCKKEDQNMLWEIVKNTLEKCVKENFSQELISSGLHRLKFDRLELEPEYGPYGLTLFLRSTLLQQQGGDALSGIQVHSLFNRLQKTLEDDPTYLTRLIEKYLLNNSHRVDLCLEPSVDLLKKEKQEEKKRLNEIQNKLTKEEKNEIVLQSKKLLDFQEAQDNLLCLPIIDIKDISLVPKRFDLLHEKKQGFDVFAYCGFTSKITYLELVYSLPSLTGEELPLVQLLSDILTEMGTREKSYRTWLEETQKNVGGLSSFLQINPSVYDPNTIEPTLHIQAKALDEKTVDMFALVKELIESADFSNKERFKELIIQEHTAMQMSINQNALNYATTLASSGLNQSTFLNEKWCGLNYFWFLQDLVKHFDQRANQIIEKCFKLLEKLIQKQSFDVILSCDEKNLAEIQENHFFGLKPPKNVSSNYLDTKFELVNPLSQTRLISSSVFFTSRVYATPTFANPESALLSLGSLIMEHGYLHTHIREKGGAYGGGARTSSSMGFMNFFGYRDPQLKSTLEHFSKAIQMILDGRFSTEKMDEAKRILIQKLDTPVYPPYKAPREYAFYRQKRSKDIEKTFREVALNASKQQIIEAVHDHLKDKKSVTITFGSKEIIEKENKMLNPPLPTFPV